MLFNSFGNIVWANKYYLTGDVFPASGVKSVSAVRFSYTTSGSAASLGIAFGGGIIYAIEVQSTDGLTIDTVRFINMVTTAVISSTGYLLDSNS